MPQARPGITGPMAGLYDLFVDWKGRLGREMPGICARLSAHDATRVLDVGCGTGRHMQALLERGFDAHGTDVSPDMLAQAAELLGGEDRLHAWRLGDRPSASLLSGAPFDAAICMGNTWPHVVDGDDLHNAATALRSLLRAGGLVLLGLKAMAVRAAERDPYLPLLRRERDGRPYWFVRFVDFEVPPASDGGRLCDLHVTVLADDAAAPEAEALLHRATRMRAWSPDELRSWFERQGFRDVSVSARLDDPDAPPVSEDVYVGALVPA